MRLACALVITTLFFNESTWAAQTQVGNNEETFVFAGTCPNGETYRLVSYQRNVYGMSQSYYDYEGPVGKGTVQSDSQPRVMAARICRKWAEIINANYWE